MRRAVAPAIKRFVLSTDGIPIRIVMIILLCTVHRIICAYGPESRLMRRGNEKRNKTLLHFDIHYYVSPQPLIRLIILYETKILCMPSQKRKPFVARRTAKNGRLTHTRAPRFLFSFSFSFFFFLYYSFLFIVRQILLIDAARAAALSRHALWRATRFRRASLFWESLVALIIYPARFKRTLYGNPFHSSSFFFPFFFSRVVSRVSSTAADKRACITAAIILL